jgi:TetR/AcrR family transcriptional regulator, regulator of cefoperazone and chloramphenicol sensitivity
MSSQELSKIQARGEATRQKIIDAGLIVFGNAGYAGTSARDVAKAAGVPLAAIPYHFTTKDNLYREVLMRVRDVMRVSLAPAIMSVQATLDGTPHAAKKALFAFQEALLTVLVASDEARHWAKILLREHMDPSTSYDVVFEDAGRSVIDLHALLIAQITGRKADDVAVIIEAVAKFGEVLIFLVTKHAVLRILNWESFGQEEAVTVAAALRD